MNWVSNTTQKEESNLDFSVDPDEWHYIHRDEQASFDDLYERFNKGYYHSLKPLEEDILSLFSRTLEARCENTLARKYIEMVLSGVMQ